LDAPSLNVNLITLSVVTEGSLARLTGGSGTS
jgi:hypothetical protein